MARNLCPDRPRETLAVGAALLTLAAPGAVGQLGAIVIGAVLGHWVAPGAPRQVVGTLGFSLKRSLATGALVAFAALLVGLPLLAAATGSHAVELVDRFYRAGSFVFGGGHVVLPLLQQAVVPPGWISNDSFLAGYGAAQAVPGPLFPFSAYLGTAMGP